MRTLTVRAVLGLAVAAAAWPAAAAAAPVSVDDADDGVTASGGQQIDLRRLTLDQSGGQTTVTAAIEPQTFDNATPNDAVHVFVDGAADGDADHVVTFSEFSQSAGTYGVFVNPAAAAGADCAEIGGPATASSTGRAIPAPDGGLVNLSYTFPTSAIGDATTLRFAAYAQTDDLSRSTFDYAPDPANPSPGRANPATQEYDGCDADGNGTFGDGSDPRTDTGRYPVALSSAVGYPAAAHGGGGTTADPFPQIAGGPFVKAAFYIAGTVAMPNVRGKTIGEARALIARAGIAQRVVGQPVTRKRKGRTAGEVLRQSPGRGVRIPRVPDNRTIKLQYYLGPIRDTSGDGCPTRALNRALKGEDPDVTQRYLDRHCDDVGTSYRFSSRVNDVELAKLRNDDTSELKIKCRVTRMGGKRVELCDVVSVPAETEKFRYAVECEIIESKQELRCDVKSIRKKRANDPDDVERILNVPEDADDLLLAMSDSRELINSDPRGRLGFTRNWRFLTTDPYERRYTCFRVQVLAFSGELAQSAKVGLAVPDGMSPDLYPVPQSTGRTGDAKFCLRLLKPGNIHVVATATGANGVTIAGIKTIKVETLREERVLLDGRRIRPRGRVADGTQLYEIVDKADLRREAQLSTGGGALSQTASLAKLQNAFVNFIGPGGAFAQVGNVPIVPAPQVEQGVAGTANASSLTLLGTGTTYSGNVDLAKARIISDNGGGLIGDHGTGIISRDGAGIVSRDGAGLVSEAGGSIIGLIGQAGGN